MNNVRVYTFAYYSKALHALLNTYTIDVLAMSPAQKMPKLKPKEERKCRFCGLDGTQTKFNNEAHLLSKMLGNRHLLSDSECDVCNLKFSEYETDLSYFLGISRTILRVRGRKNKVPDFHSIDKLLSARQEEFNGITDGIKIERQGTDNDAFRIFDDEGRAEITTHKQPYVPARVYKAFLKMAISALPEDQLENYERAIKILMSDAHDAKCSWLYKLIHHQLPSNYAEPRPYCMVLRKLDPEGRRVSHQFYLRYQNHVYILLLPFHLEDILLGLYNEGQITTNLSPPLLFSAPAQSTAECVSEVRDLSSGEPYREEEVLTFQMEPNAMKNAHIINQDTGEPMPGEFDPKDIIGMYIAPAGATLTFPQVGPSKEAAAN